MGRMRLTVCIAVLWMVAVGAQGAVLTVPVPYATISAAVAAASPGDTVQIAAGTYAENVLITKSIILDGAGSDAGGTVISPTFGNGITVNTSAPSASVTLQELRVTGCNKGAASDPQAGIAFIVNAGTAMVSDVVVAPDSALEGICILGGSGNIGFTNVRVQGTTVRSALSVWYPASLLGLSCSNVRLEATTTRQLDLVGTPGGTTWNIGSMVFGASCGAFIYLDAIPSPAAGNVHIATAEFQPSGLTPAQIEAKIWHHPDNANVGLVTYNSGTVPASVVAFDESTQKFYLCTDGGDPAGSGSEIQSGVTYTLDGHSLVMTITGIPGDKRLVVQSPAESNSLRVVWYLRNGLLYRGVETGTTLAGVQSLSHQREMTYYGGIWHDGWQGITHSLSWDGANSRWRVTAGIAQH